MSGPTFCTFPSTATAEDVVPGVTLNFRELASVLEIGENPAVLFSRIWLVGNKDARLKADEI